jgi:hypothetical protein
MYIRRTHTTNSATGERYTTHRLVQSERVGGRVRQVTLLKPGPPVHTGGPAGGDVQAVDVDSLELSRPRSVGVESVALWAMAEVRFIALLAHLGLSGPQRALIVGAIIGRMAAPGSERATHRWLSARSALGELLEVDFATLPLAPFYRVADLLMRHRAVIEQTVLTRVSDLFGLDWTVTLYDLTNTFFDGTAVGNPKAQRGHSKLLFRMPGRQGAGDLRALSPCASKPTCKPCMRAWRGHAPPSRLTSAGSASGA